MYAATRAPQGARWGLLGTVFWSLVIATGLVVVEFFAIGLFIGTQYGTVPRADYQALVQEHQFNGMLLSISAILTMVVGITMTLVIIWLKKGANLKDYLGWRLPERKTAAQHFMLFVAFLLITDALTLALGKPVVTEFMVEAYKTATLPWFLLFALVVAAPLTEELLFRGFLFSGLEISMLGPLGAAVVSSALWAAVHTQYEFFYLVMIFFMGLLLCWVRRRSGSLLLTMGLHAFANVVASVETVALVN